MTTIFTLPYIFPSTSPDLYIHALVGAWQFAHPFAPYSCRGYTPYCLWWHTIHTFSFTGLFELIVWFIIGNNYVWYMHVPCVFFSFDTFWFDCYACPFAYPCLFEKLCIAYICKLSLKLHTYLRLFTLMLFIIIHPWMSHWILLAFKLHELLTLPIFMIKEYLIFFSLNANNAFVQNIANNMFHVLRILLVYHKFKMTLSFI